MIRLGVHTMPHIYRRNGVFYLLQHRPVQARIQRGRFYIVKSEQGTANLIKELNPRPASKLANVEFGVVLTIRPFASKYVISIKTGFQGIFYDM